MESSRRDLFIDMVVDKSIFENNHITLFPCYTFIFKTGVGLPKTEASFYCVRTVNFEDSFFFVVFFSSHTQL